MHCIIMAYDSAAICEIFQYLYNNGILYVDIDESE